MITQEQIKEILQYDPLSGNFVWIKTNSNRVKKGTLAGYERKDGYRIIGINGKDYLAHRLAWIYVYGREPKVIDHVDMNKSNNKICNLRDVTQVENMLNVKDCQSNNKSSGLRGVSYDKKAKRYVAQLKGKFLGYFSDPQMAHSMYVKEKDAACRKALEKA